VTTTRSNRAFVKRIVVLYISALFFAFALFALQILSFVSPSIDQFNVFHRFDQVYSLENWNMPYNVHEDIDGDGKEDKVTFYHCIYLSSVDSATIPQQNACTTELYQNDGKKTNTIKVKGYQIAKPPLKIINSYLGRNGTTWQLVINTLGGTEVYEITKEGRVVEREAPFSLKVDSSLYTLSHLFTLIF
jgi:hypothetical protein